MKKTMLFFSIICCMPNTNTMKRSSEWPTSRKDLFKKRQVVPIDTTEKKIVPFDFVALPKELQIAVFDFSTHNTTAEEPQIAAKTINSLAQIKQFTATINEPVFSDRLIINLARKYSCPHENIAKSLQTQQSLIRFKLQDKIRVLRHYTRESSIRDQLSRLITQGFDLNFTYNDNNTEKTPFMMSMGHNNPLRYILLEQGAHINGCNAQGVSALALIVTTQLIHYPHFCSLINAPNININQQDINGATPLLQSLLSRKKYLISTSFYRVIMGLLNAGADPEIADKQGNTPLSVARSLNNRRTIELIENAIADKYKN